MASGAMWFAKSDVVSKLFRIEAKTKAKPGAKTFSIKKEWLDKVKEETYGSDKMPALAFSFGDNKDYFVLEDRDFYGIVEELLQLRELRDNNGLN